MFILHWICPVVALVDNLHVPESKRVSEASPFLVWVHSHVSWVTLSPGNSWCVWESRPIILPLLWSNWIHHTCNFIPYTSLTLAGLNHLPPYSWSPQWASLHHYLFDVGLVPAFSLPHWTISSSWMMKSSNRCHSSCHVQTLNMGLCRWQPITDISKLIYISSSQCPPAHPPACTSPHIHNKIYSPLVPNCRGENYILVFSLFCWTKYKGK